MAKTEILNNDVATLRVDESVGDILKEAADITEETIDLIEEHLENVQTIVRNNPYLIAGAFVLGAGVGGFIAWKIAVKRTETRYEQIMAEEMDAARRFYKRLAKEGPFETPESAVKELVPEAAADAIKTYQGKEQKVPYNRPDDIAEAVEERVEVTEKVTIERNVFDAVEETRDWDYQEEIKRREANPDEPYVISFEEFNENEPGHEQITLAYYAEDDTLADEKDQPVDNTDYLVGDDNLLRFGAGSHDRKVVYIRNERIDVDFEVVRSGGSYKKEVLGFDEETELRHSHRRSRRMRGTDE